jgi:hypothetical protein
MGATHVLPPPLATACAAGHPVELWILVNGEIVQCAGNFLRTDERGRPQLSAALPEGFVGIMRTGAAVRGFFQDGDSAVHTFLTSIHDWAPYRDRPSAARVVLEAPSLVAPCERRRGDRRRTNPLVARLSVQIRGERVSIKGKLVDLSASGVGVRTVRTSATWFAEGTRLDVEVDLPSRAEPARLTATVARVGREAHNYLYGLRVDGGAAGRKMLTEILDALV